MRLERSESAPKQRIELYKSDQAINQSRPYASAKKKTKSQEFQTFALLLGVFKWHGNEEGHLINVCVWGGGGYTYIWECQSPQNKSIH